MFQKSALNYHLMNRIYPFDKYHILSIRGPPTHDLTDAFGLMLTPMNNEASCLIAPWSLRLIWLKVTFGVNSESELCS